MTWNELIYRLQETIPEERREEEAVFIVGTDDDIEGHVIDDLELIGMDIGVFDCNVGDEKMETTYALSK